MAFSTSCTNKGCYKHMQPYIDPVTNEVFCSICDKTILNITQIAKNQMKSMKQFRQKKSTSFVTKCKSCNKEERPVILSNKICCPLCKKEHLHLSQIYKNMLLENLKKANEDI